MTRRTPVGESAGARLEWFRGDLRSERDLDAAVRDVRGVVHVGGWVSLGTDRSGVSRRVNVDATRDLIDRAEDAGIERFVYTSTLWTTASGTPERPADESSAWNLDAIRSSYSETKREAERLVLDRNGSGMRTTVICPGMVVGPGDRRPSSTGLLLSMARSPVVTVPRGGIPLVDVRVLAEAHRRALESGTPGSRYIVVGPYLSYPEMARLVSRVARRPRRVVVVPDWCEPLLRKLAAFTDRVASGRLSNVSGAAVAGGFLKLIVSGSRADAEFGLRHPPPIRSIYEALEDHRRSGRAPWLPALKVPEDVNTSEDGLRLPAPVVPHLGGEGQ
jgi:dihydroflavonol-4-reductase